MLLCGASSFTITVLLSRLNSIGQSTVTSARPIASNANVLVYGTLTLYIIVGLSADVRFGRYRVTACSMLISLPSLLASSLFTLIAIAVSNEKLLWVGIGLYILHFIALIPFEGTIMHFGLDQLSDASSDEQSSFIHWYVWTIAIAELPPNFISSSNSKAVCFILLVISIVIISGMLVICLAWYRGACGCNMKFICEPPSTSPYMCIFKVLQFAKNHKTPVNRSAFTYWEDNAPLRLDVGKEKYGGPFTNEQVEDVKTLLRLLCFLSCVLMMYFAVFISFIEPFVLHFGSDQQNSYSINPKNPAYLVTGSIVCSPQFFAAFFIPFHELVLHPMLGNRYLPSIMSKMKIAGILISANLAISLIIDGVGHSKQDVQCMFSAYYNITLLPGQVQAIGVSPLVLILPCLMADLAISLLFVSILEFIVAQTPYSMRGMMIGFFYFMTGLHALLAVGYGYIFPSSSPGYSCCSLYYTIGTVIAFAITLLTFAVTRSYKYRERSEVINEYQFIENYYSTNRSTTHSS